MPPNRLRLFGQPSVEQGAEVHPLAGSRPIQLLAYLAVSGSWQGRDQLAHLFWPDRSNKIARSNFRNLLCKVPGAAPFASLESTEHAIRFRVLSDLQDFDAALRLQDWDAAVQLGARELLQGFENTASEPYLLWLRAEREARLGQWKQAVQALLAQSTEPVAQREALAQSWAARCPFDEDAVQARVGLAYERRQAAAAAAIYRAFEARLRDELGVRPSVELERCALRAPSLAVAMPGPVPAAHTAASARPAIIGRRLELRQLATLLKAEGAQLVTLTGTGGVGKSALLAAFHRSWVEAGGTNTFLIDVSGAPSAKAALGNIASALGVTVPQGVAEEEALADALGGRAWVLMLDGVEQAGLATPMATLLERCPQTRWLIASRQRLHLDNEQLLVLDGFPLPDADEADAELLGANDGVRFLADAIIKAGRSVNLAQDAADLAAIVRAVEGLPLALKLLGKLTHLFSLHQLLESVQPHAVPGGLAADSLELTELMPPLLASFQRSWMSLSAPEQVVLARLAVFPAEFEVSAGRWVAQAELPLITSLVDRSLLRASGAGRLSMHAAIRSCVKAVCPQVAAEAIPGYVGYYKQRLRALAGLARNTTVRPLRQFLYAERALLDHAWVLALELRDYAALLSLQESVWFMDDGTSTVIQIAARCVEAERLIRDDPTVPPALRAMLLAGISYYNFQQVRHSLAVDYGQQALIEARRARHHDATVSALITLGWISAQQGDSEQVAAQMTRLETLINRMGERNGRLALNIPGIRALLCIARRDLEAGIEQYELAASASRQVEDFHAELVFLMHMAGAYHSFNRPDRAVPFEERGITVGAAEKVDPALVASYLSAFAHWHIQSGDIERAQVCMERADALMCDRPQTQILRLKIQLGHAAVLTAQQDLAAARAHLDKILDVLSRGDMPVVSNTAFLVTGKWFEQAGERQPCVQALREVRLGSASARDVRDFKAAQAMLHGLGEESLEADPLESQRSQSCMAAAAARRRMSQTAVPVRDRQLSQ